MRDYNEPTLENIMLKLNNIERKVCPWVQCPECGKNMKDVGYETCPSCSKSKKKDFADDLTNNF